jgi:hypothetical protein
MTTTQQRVKEENRSELKTTTNIMEMMHAPGPAKPPWKKMWSLRAGHNLHHQTNQVVNFAKDGIKATNEKENIQITCSHFEKVYNRESSFDLTDVPQGPENPNIDQRPTIKKLNKAIADSHGIAGSSRTVGPLFNCNEKLPKEAREALLSIIHHYWNGLDKTPEWNQALLCIIYKKKGKQDDINNYRGICLQDLIARYVSSKISSCLIKMLKEHGIEEQIGCQPLCGCRWMHSS